MIICHLNSCINFVISLSASFLQPNLHSSARVIFFRMRSDYVSSLFKSLKSFLTPFLTGVFREDDIHSGFWRSLWHHPIPFSPYCFIPQMFLSLNLPSPFLPVAFTYVAFCTQNAFHQLIMYRAHSHLCYQFTCHHFRDSSLTTLCSVLLPFNTTYSLSYCS